MNRLRVPVTLIALAAWLTVSPLPAQAPRVLLDIEPGIGGCDPAFWHVASGRAYFSAQTTATGREPWVTDGTARGTLQLGDLVPGPGSSVPRTFTTLGDRVLFYADQSLYITGGTPASTKLVKSGIGNRFRSAAALGDRVLFDALGPEGVELWITDGTPSGTRLLKDLDPLSSSFPAELVRIGDTVYFSAQRSLREGSELWRTDGTMSGTRMIMDLNPGPGSGIVGRSVPFRGELLFVGTDGRRGIELWMTDGTAAGTRIVTDLAPGSANSFPSSLVVAGDRVFFVPLNLDSELWATDGTATGTYRVKDIRPNGAGYPTGMARLGSSVVFFADDGSHGREPWVSDGTAAGTRMLKDISPFRGSGGILMQPVGSRHAWFRGDDRIHGTELWVTDGTPSGTRMVADLATRGDSHPTMFHALNDKLVFTAYTEAAGFEAMVMNVGAWAYPTGRPCGFAQRDPSLEATDPVLGSIMEFRGRSAQPGTSGALLVARPSPPVRLGVGCYAHLDRNSIGLLMPITATGSDWRAGFRIPATPTLDGLQVSFQAILGPTPTPLGMDITNAIRARLGR